MGCLRIGSFVSRQDGDTGWSGSRSTRSTREEWRGNVDDPHHFTITDAEVLAVGGGVDEATGQPVVVLTLRPITGSGWGHVNYSLHPDNARSMLDRLSREFHTSPHLKSGPPGTTT
jgi:hypothetical protein